MKSGPVLAQKHVLHKYANEDVSLGPWFIRLDVQHFDDRRLCCGSPPGNSPSSHLNLHAQGKAALSHSLIWKLSESLHKIRSIEDLSRGSDLYRSVKSLKLGAWSLELACLGILYFNIMTSQRVEVKCGERKYPFKRYEYDFIEGEDTFIGWLYFRGGTKRRVTFFKTEKTKCKLIWKRSLAIGEVEGAQRCWFWTRCQISRCFLLCYDLFEPLSSCAIEEPFNASQRVQNWLLLKGTPGLDFFDTVDAGLSQWWRHNIKRILTTVKSIHDEGFSNGNLRDMGCFVISKNTINLICIGGGESLMDKDNFEALRLKKDDLIGVKEVLEQCLGQSLPPHISLDRFYFFNMFNKNLDEFGVGIDYDQFVDKLITHPFLLSPRARLEYGFTLGSAKETADICDGEYGGGYGKNGFTYYLNNDASLSTFQDWTQLIENLRTLASNYQGELTDEILEYEIFWTALDHKGKGYNTGAEELLRFLRNIYPHYVNSWNENVIDHYVGQVLCPGFLSMLHANVVLLKCKT